MDGSKTPQRENQIMMVMTRETETLSPESLRVIEYVMSDSHAEEYPEDSMHDTI